MYNPKYGQTSYPIIQLSAVIMERLKNRASSMKPAMGLFIMFLTVVCTYAQEEDRMLGIDDILSLKKIRDMQISPDERWIAFVLTSIDNKR